MLFLTIVMPGLSNAQSGWQNRGSLPAAPVNVQDVFFADSLTGWATNRWGYDSSTWIFFTKDGGASWNRQISPTQRILNKVEFFNGIGYCVGFNGTILKTMDGGVHWILKPSNTTRDLSFITFVNPQVGWAGSGDSAIVKTNDGGETWVPQVMKGSVSSISFVNALNGMAVGYGTVLKTTDGGATWISIPGPSNNPFFITIQCLTAQDIIISGRGIARSSDGGLTWTQISTMNVADLSFADKRNGWAVGDSIIRTTDGGRSWSNQSYKSPKSLSTISGLDSLHAFAGYEHDIFSTKNGGRYTIEPPQTPILASPIDGASDQVPGLSLSWIAVSDAKTYRLQIATDSMFAGIVYTDSAIVTAYKTVTPLLFNTVYWWRVKANNGTYQSGWSSSWKFSTTAGTVLLVSPLKNEESIIRSPKLTWSGSIGSSISHVQLTTDTSSGGRPVLDTETSSSTYPVGPLVLKTNYYWRVAAKYGSVYGDWSEWRRFTIRDSLNTNFPMTVGTKWYYQCYSMYPTLSLGDSMYGMIKEIIDTTQNGFRTVRVTKLYPTTTKTAFEYLYAADGQLYQTSGSALTDLVYPVYNAELKADWSVMFTYYHPYAAQFFGLQTDAQKMTSGIYLKLYQETKSYITTRDFGIICYAIVSSQASNKLQDDSTILIGLLKNGIVYGDTMLINFTARTPSQITLYQNYPNPFNPSTTIIFRLPYRSFASLKIFDVLGREVTTLASEDLPAGNYSREWNASGNPSGVYFYRLQAGTFTETKKLLLQK